MYLSVVDEYVLSGSEDRQLVMWDLVSGEVVGEQVAHGRKVTSVSYYPLKRPVLTSGVNGMVVVWE